MKSRGSGEQPILRKPPPWGIPFPAAIAVGFGLKFLARGFEQLNARFGGGLRVWTIIFVLVLLQMTAALRPILGTSDAFLPTEKKFFVSHWKDSLKASGNGGVSR